MATIWVELTEQEVAVVRLALGAHYAEMLRYLQRHPDNAQGMNGEARRQADMATDVRDRLRGLTPNPTDNHLNPNQERQ